MLTQKKVVLPLIVGLLGILLGGALGYLAIAAAVLIRVAYEPIPVIEQRTVQLPKRTSRPRRTYVINSLNLSAS